MRGPGGSRQQQQWAESGPGAQLASRVQGLTGSGSAVASRSPRVPGRSRQDRCRACTGEGFLETGRARPGRRGSQGGVEQASSLSHLADVSEWRSSSEVGCADLQIFTASSEAPRGVGPGSSCREPWPGHGPQAACLVPSEPWRTSCPLVEK